ncbi:DcaP family trimeric outer membrane transporter [Thalassolituus marinus]|uniref:Porin n=1 Tax=Thalassolituus marinus TaxID=671053 RepID=A0ABS7ZQJ1_9GAMM|nr:DcaP family trimeric outer membrane transporter [Thalassolituus marinus]MCA6063974.1 hypothetical protein [Thalassolituus marinus]
MRKTSLVLLASALPLAVQAANTEFTFGGYVKLDAMMSTYSDGPLTVGLGEDFYVPAAIPTGGDETTSFDMNAKSSRFNLKSVSTLDNGEKVTAFFEMDFLASGQGTERITNAYAPRLRHAFFNYGNLTFGQTWTTFMNTGALPETVDFLGVSDGTVFARQPQIRYTMGDFQFALENANTTLDGSGDTALTDDNTLPDIVARYNMKMGDHAFTVSAIARQFATQDGAGVDESANGFGINVSGKIMVGGDDLKFSYTTGNVSRYVGLSQLPDAITSGSSIEPTDVTGAFVAYRHHWNSQMRSTLAYSMYDAEQDDGVERSSNSTRLNLMYSPTKAVTYGVGVEYTMANIDKDGVEGDMSRIHFTAKYSF